MADVFEDFKAGLEEAGITNETLQENCADIVGKLGEIIDQKFELENEIAELTAKLEEKNKLLLEYDRIKIPELVSAAGLSEVTTKIGYKISIKEEYRGAISEANSETALDWFIRSGGADTVKNNYIIPISIKDKQVAKQLEEILKRVGLDYSRQIKIAWNTLAGVIKELDTTGQLENNIYFEQLKKDKGLDPELTLAKVLGAYHYKTTKVQKPKAKKK